MSVYEAKSYVDFLTQAIQVGGKKRRGIIKTLAGKIGCHPTFISQVINGKADLNHDQAIKVCLFLQLSHDETEFFIDLLNRDRAATSQAKSHFQRIIDRKVSDRVVFHKRANLKSNISLDQEVKYLSRWLHPVVHAAIQIPDLRSPEKLSKILKVETGDAKEALETLVSLGLAKKERGEWVPTQADLHVGKDSPLASNYHANWRLKIAASLVTSKRGLDQTHYSSIFAISKEVAEEVRVQILKNLENVRKRMVASPSEELYVLCLDYCPLT